MKCTAYWILKKSYKERGPDPPEIHVTELTGIRISFSVCKTGVVQSEACFKILS